MGVAWQSLIEFKDTVPASVPPGQQPVPTPAVRGRPLWPLWPTIVAASLLGSITLGVIVYINSGKGDGKVAATDVPTTTGKFDESRIQDEPPSVARPPATPDDRSRATHDPVPAPVSAETITNSIGMSLRLIPAGTFLMGSPFDDPPYPSDDPKYTQRNKPQHTVRITRPFYLSAYEVTQEEYHKVIGTNPSRSRGDRNLPVDSVSWFDAAIYCNQLSLRENRAPYYKMAPGAVTILGGDGYRLPTEAEWEYACLRGHVHEVQLWR